MQAPNSRRSLTLVLLGLSVVSAQYISPGRPQRPQRSLDGWSPSISTGWSSGPPSTGWSSLPPPPSHHHHHSPPHISFSSSPPSHSPHIGKDELIALLHAWKDVERTTTTTTTTTPRPTPEPETPARPAPEDDDDDDDDGDDGDDDADPEPEQPAPGTPLTVSLPALVPIQLAAMWTQPGPVRGAGIGVGPAPGGLPPLQGLPGLGGFGLGGGGLAFAGAGAGAVGGRFGRPRFRGRANRRSGTRKSSSIRFPVANPRSYASSNYVSRPRYYRSIDVLPSNAAFVTNAAPVQFVPSNWQ